MSLTSSELSELFTVWGELNVSDHENISRVDTHVCPTYFSRSVLLRSMCTLYIFIFVLGVAANAVVIWVNVCSERCYRHEMRVYILNLAVADLSVVATLPVWASSLVQEGHWPFGQAACRLTHLVFSVSLFASIFILACMGVDRYLSVVRKEEASSWKERSMRHLVCTGVWVVALIASVPDTYFLQSVKSGHGDLTLCHPVYPESSPLQWMVGIQLTFIVLGFAVPFPVIVISYALLANGLASSNRNQDRSISKTTILTYILVFLICWGPYQAILLYDSLAMLRLLSLSCEAENSLFVAMHLTQCLSLLHCCLNPVIYSFTQRHYHYNFMKAFIFKYSTRTGLAHLMEDSQGTETQYTAIESQP